MHIIFRIFVLLKSFEKIIPLVKSITFLTTKTVLFQHKHFSFMQSGIGFKNVFLKHYLNFVKKKIK